MQVIKCFIVGDDTYERWVLLQRIDPATYLVYTLVASGHMS